MPLALIAQFVSQKRYLAILTIYLLSHLVNYNGGGVVVVLWRIDKALDGVGVDVIFAVFKRCFEFFLFESIVGEWIQICLSAGKPLSAS